MENKTDEIYIDIVHMTSLRYRQTLACMAETVDVKY